MRAFQMLKVEGRSGGEVAKVLGMTVAAVYKARERVAKDLKDEFMRLRSMDSAA